MSQRTEGLREAARHHNGVFCRTSDAGLFAEAADYIESIENTLREHQLVDGLMDEDEPDMRSAKKGTDRP